MRFLPERCHHEPMKAGWPMANQTEYGRSTFNRAAGIPSSAPGYQPRFRPVVVSAVIGLAVLACGLIVDAAFMGERRPVMVSDGLTAVVATLLSYRLVRQYAIAQAIAERRMRVISDVNHHVRNALTAILYSAHLQKDPTLLKTTETAAHRIDWVLQTILPSYESGSNGQKASVPSRFGDRACESKQSESCDA
jgi:hypothetical protein